MSQTNKKPRNSALRKTAVSRSALKVGFEVVFEVNEHLGNVIASDAPTDGDLELKKKCEKFIKWYKHFC